MKRCIGCVLRAGRDAVRGTGAIRIAAGTDCRCSCKDMAGEDKRGPEVRACPGPWHSSIARPDSLRPAQPLLPRLGRFQLCPTALGPDACPGSPNAAPCSGHPPIPVNLDLGSTTTWIFDLVSRPARQSCIRTRRTLLYSVAARINSARVCVLLSR